MSNWIHDLYSTIDRLDVPGTTAYFADDGVVVFGNNPPAVGHDAIAGALTGFWATIGGMHHEIKHTWTSDGATVLEAVCSYTRHSGETVPIGCSTVIERRPDGLIDSLRIYIDLAPLFAEAVA